MRKWLTRCAVAAALILIVLLAVEYQLRPLGIQVGKPLPPGKVKPQLVNGYDSAVKGSVNDNVIYVLGSASCFGLTACVGRKGRI
jgi:hypothetical protein